MHVRLYSVHLEALTEEGWQGWDTVNVALTEKDQAAPEAMTRGLELCRNATTTGEKPETLRVREVRFIAEGHT